MQKYSKTKAGDSFALSKIKWHPKELFASKNNRDSENQTFSNCNGTLKCKRYDEKQTSFEKDSPTETV